MASFRYALRLVVETTSSSVPELFQPEQPRDQASHGEGDTHATTQPNAKPG